jgi:hypothetical protein
MEQPVLPVFTLEGLPVDPLRQSAGSPTLVLFYHTACLGCTGRALPLGYALSKEYPALQWLVVHADFPSMPVSKNELLAIFTDAQPPVPIYRDPGAREYHRYAAEGTPHWLLFQSDGTLSHSIFGSQEGAQNRLYFALEECLGRTV